MTRAYWRAGRAHSPGYVVEPGSWGRGVTARSEAHPRHAVEEVLEAARPPGFPSRSAVGFAFADWRSALYLPWGRPYIHRVEVRDDGLSRHDARLTDAVSAALAAGDVEAAEAAARRYWHGPPSPRPAWELLTPYPFTVVAFVYEHRPTPGEERIPDLPEPN